MDWRKEASVGLSLTLDNVDPDLLDRLRVEAQRRGVGVDAVIEQIIRDGLNPSLAADSVQAHHELDRLGGTWSAKDAEDFLSATSDLRRVDEDLWK
jgi:hypothetical protein